MTYDAIVVGAGHNGVVCAAYLARSGLRVLVLERAEEVGGASRTVEIAPGYRAPALLHDAGRIRRSVIRDLRLGSLRLLKPEVPAFIPDPDGGGIALHADPVRTAEELKARSPQDAEAYAGFDRRIRSMASFLAYAAVATPPDIEQPSLSDAIAGLRIGRAFRRLGDRAGREVLRTLPMPVADLVGDFFETELLRAVLASRGVALTAMGPWTAGTGARFLMDAVGGGGAAGRTAYVEGGPGVLARALAGAARAAGAEVRTGAEVVGITSRGGRTTGAALASGEEIAARAVVSAADPKRTLRWLDPVAAGPSLLWRGRHIRAPGVVAKVNLALSALPTFREVDDPTRLSGRIVIGPGIDHLERAADDAKYGRISEAPWLDVAIPSLTDPTLAPEAGHVMSVFFHSAPYDVRDGGWNARARDHVGRTTVSILESYAPGIRKLVEGRQVLAPPDIEEEFGVTNGAILHAEPGLDQFFAWRPLLGHARYRFGIPGLYLAGSGAHPGGGITGGPGANAAREVISDLRR
jgi:phytoene dehydrogenase-like protein